MTKNQIRKKIVRACFCCIENRFVVIGEYNGSLYTVFMTKRPISRNSLRVGTYDSFGGLCKYRIIRDAKMHIGFVFCSKTNFTRVTPVSLVVTFGSDISDFREIPLPPKIGILTFLSQNSSVLIVPSEDVELPYVVTGE